MSEPATPYDTDTDTDTSRADQRVTDHYRTLLAANYTWMLGDDIERTASEQRDVLGALLPRPAEPGLALDLGCGSGAQSLALADLGYAPVLAVDTDPTLLDELRRHCADRPDIQAIQTDAVTAVADLDPQSAQVAVCMGDTLLHLPSAGAVSELLRGLSRALAPGGVVVLTYRDLTHELRGAERFIPVRSDDQRIMVCFLEVADRDVVEVHDIIHTRTEQGWTMSASSYPKLRLAPAWVRDELSDAGLEITHHEPSASGMWRTLARRPAAA